MLRKLIKHDFKATSKVLIPVNLILIVITAFGSILLSTRLLQRDELMLLSVALMMTYILAIGSLSLITSIYLMVHYYRNMFSAQGYLTFTLPASSWDLFHSKLITGFVWALINSVLTFLSVFTLLWCGSGFQTPSSLFTEMFAGDSLLTVEGVSLDISVSVFDVFGYTPGQLILLMVLFTLISCFYTIAMSYGSATIGQLYAKHKIAGTVLTYIGLYFITELITTFSILFLSIHSVLEAVLDFSAELESPAVIIGIMQSIYRPMLPTLIIIFLVIGIICYVVSGLILKKKVNLD